METLSYENLVAGNLVCYHLNFASISVSVDKVKNRSVGFYRISGNIVILTWVIIMF